MIHFRLFQIAVLECFQCSKSYHVNYTQYLLTEKCLEKPKCEVSGKLKKKLRWVPLFRRTGFVVLAETRLLLSKAVLFLNKSVFTELVVCTCYLNFPVFLVLTIVTVFRI